MTAHDKDGKSERAAGVTPRAVKTVVGGVPQLPAASPLDLDMEELSGSLLLDEASGRGAQTGAGPERPPAPVSPFLPAVSSRPLHAAVPMLPLPKPTPPPKFDLIVQSSEPPPTTPAMTLPSDTLSEHSSASTEDAQSALPARPGEAVRPSPRPRADPVAGDIELTTHRQGVLNPIFRAMKDRFRSASAILPFRDSRRAGRAGLPIRAVAAVLAAVGLIVLVVMAIRARGAPARPPLSPVATVLPAATPAATVLPAQRPSVPDPTTAVAACAVSGDPHVLAPGAIVAAGIEVRAFGDDVALGFAPNEHQATLLRLDPVSLSPLESTAIRSVRRVVRATPIPGKRGRLGLAVDVDRKGDPLQGRRTVPMDPPIQVGVAAGALAWAPLGGRRVQGSLWPLDGDDVVEALRGARSESNLSMIAIAFRRAGAVWVGTAERSTTLAAKGPLLRVPGLGPLVGSPAIAVNEGVVVVAWAERPASDDPWRLRWMHFKVGEASGEPATFMPPAGSKGDEAMSPGLTVVPGGRFLLVWTEGPAGAHEVRAMTLSADGAPIGSPLRISNGGVNAGQGQVAMTPKGRGIVAFLESQANGFRVAATPIACAP